MRTLRWTYYVCLQSSAPHLSGKPSYSLQAVQLLQAPVQMQQPSTIHKGKHQPVSKMLCRAEFDLSSGNISFALRQG